MPWMFWEIQLKSLMMFDAFTTSMKRSSDSRYVNTSSTNVPLGVVSAEYCACPAASREASFVVMCWTAFNASAPAISISPMCDTSNRPARVRTAMCSSTMPLYSTGMSQPPNSTMRAPSARCRACSGVFLRVSEAGCVIGSDAGQPLQRAQAGEYPINVLCAPAGVKAGITCVLRFHPLSLALVLAAAQPADQETMSAQESGSPTSKYGCGVRARQWTARHGYSCSLLDERCRLWWSGPPATA